MPLLSGNSVCGHGARFYFTIPPGESREFRSTSSPSPCPFQLAPKPRFHPQDQDRRRPQGRQAERQFRQEADGPAVLPAGLHRRLHAGDVRHHRRSRPVLRPRRRSLRHQRGQPVRQEAWAKQNKIGVTLLSDLNKTVTKAYDVVFPNLAGVGDTPPARRS
jgi:hypothetical protein